MSTQKILSKSKLMEGLQCEKKLYFSVYQPDLAPEVSTSQQAIFDQGNEVGEEARKQFPNGVLITANHMQRDLALEQTAKALASDALAIFEGAFLFDGFFARVDVLKRKSKTSKAWEMLEVKSGTRPESKYIDDAAVQRMIVEGSGLKLKSVSLMLINTDCVYPDLANLFYTEDVTDQTAEQSPALKKTIKQLQKMISKKLEPELDIGPHCAAPYDCQYTAHCWGKRNIPEVSVFDIPSLRSDVKWDLYKRGITDLRKIGDLRLNANQKRMVAVTISGKRFVDKVFLQGAIKKWEFPLHYLDFEAVQFAIPRYKGTSPYQALPFQFSCHIESGVGKKLEHVEFLHLKDSDPREACARALVESIGEEGSVVAYWKSYEGRVLKELAELFPKYRKKLLSIAERLVDPQPLIKAGVYDPKFVGSFSIKDVAPALIGNKTSYDDMLVGDGSTAQVAYKQMIDLSLSTAHREELRAALLKYCEKDTMNMVQLVEWMRGQ